MLVADLHTLWTGGAEDQAPAQQRQLAQAVQRIAHKHTASLGTYRVLGDSAGEIAHGASASKRAGAWLPERDWAALRHVRRHFPPPFLTTLSKADDSVSWCGSCNSTGVRVCPPVLQLAQDTETRALAPNALQEMRSQGLLAATFEQMAEESAAGSAFDAWTWTSSPVERRGMIPPRRVPGGIEPLGQGGFASTRLAS
jgi:hypothetical protein